MRKKVMTGWALAWVLATAGSLEAHHSLAQFDTTTAITVRGTIVLFERVNPHSVILVDQKAEDGTTRRWALEGPGILRLTRMGIEADALKAGDVIEACGYVLKDGIEPKRRTISTNASSNLNEKSVSGRVLSAESLILRDGKRQSWEDYGHHKCLGADYQDLHAR